MTKRLSPSAILKLIEARLAHLRNGFTDPHHVNHPQERDLMFARQGEIDALEDVRLLLRGDRRTFIGGVGSYVPLHQRSAKPGTSPELMKSLAILAQLK